MTDVSGRNFGLLIAYVIPGFVVVATAATRFEIVRLWLGTSGEAAPTVGGFLYVTIGALAAGMTLGALRWLILDKINHVTGVDRPDWDWSRLQPSRSSFEYLAEMHFRYYEFFAHMLIATLIAMFNLAELSRLFAARPIFVLLALAGVATLYFVASRDSLRKYYDRTKRVLGE